MHVKSAGLLTVLTLSSLRTGRLALGPSSLTLSVFALSPASQRLTPPTSTSIVSDCLRHSHTPWKRREQHPERPGGRQSVPSGVPWPTLFAMRLCLRRPCC